MRTTARRRAGPVRLLHRHRRRRQPWRAHYHCWLLHPCLQASLSLLSRNRRRRRWCWIQLRSVNCRHGATFMQVQTGDGWQLRHLSAQLQHQLSYVDRRLRLPCCQHSAPDAALAALLVSLAPDSCQPRYHNGGRHAKFQQTILGTSCPVRLHRHCDTQRQGKVAISTTPGQNCNSGDAGHVAQSQPDQAMLSDATGLANCTLPSHRRVAGILQPPTHARGTPNQTRCSISVSRVPEPQGHNGRMMFCRVQLSRKPCRARHIS